MMIIQCNKQTYYDDVMWFIQWLWLGSEKRNRSQLNAKRKMYESFSK